MEKSDKPKKANSTFSSRCEILAELWLERLEDGEFEGFLNNIREEFEYRDLGLPLSFLLHSQIVKPTEAAKNCVNETFEMLAACLVEIDPDHNWGSLNQMLEASIDNDLRSMPGYEEDD